MIRLRFSARLLLCLAMLGLVSSPVWAFESCKPLFNGEDLSGWTVLGDARFEVIDGVIRGTPVDTEANSFLATAATYGDFQLHLEFKFQEGMFNSGVQFRSTRYQQETPVRFRSGDGAWHEATMAPGRVTGYQAEIDPSDRNWSAEIYDEAARGWLQAPDGQRPRKPIAPGRWHRMSIRAQGPSIHTTLDGESVAVMEDDARNHGFIALQVHGVYEPEQVGKTIEFRGLTLCQP